MVEPKGEKSLKSKTTGKRKAKLLITPTTSPAGMKFYCEMHRPNRTHNTKDCFELNQRAKRAKANSSCVKTDKAAYKDLNTFVNTKVTKVLKKAKKEQKEKRQKVDSSSDEESNHKVNALAAASDDDSDSDDSRVL
eukprot:10624938-Ditylum_brightwellii.AAC.1